MAKNKLIIIEVVRFVCSDSYENGITKEQVLAKCSDKSPFRVSRAQKLWTGIFKASNALTNLQNNMMEEKAGSRSRIPRMDRKT